MQRWPQTSQTRLGQKLRSAALKDQRAASVLFVWVSPPHSGKLPSSSNHEVESLKTTYRSRVRMGNIQGKDSPKLLFFSPFCLSHKLFIWILGRCPRFIWVFVVVAHALRLLRVSLTVGMCLFWSSNIVGSPYPQVWHQSWFDCQWMLSPWLEISQLQLEGSLLSCREVRCSLPAPWRFLKGTSGFMAPLSRKSTEFGVCARDRDFP